MLFIINKNFLARNDILMAPDTEKSSEAEIGKILFQPPGFFGAFLTAVT